MANFKKENYLQILFFLSIITLGSAFIIEYFFGYIPCNLCKIERIPYGLSIIILITNYNFKGNQIFYSVLLMLVFSFSIIISIYHLFIEQGFIDESTLCASENVNLLTKEEILNSLKKLSISCKDVAFKIFGFSLTIYNMIISIIMFILSAKIYVTSNDIKK
tara:strand:+ start:104 stop:589 length:486 start_codon:yes stop_codon:yes gene_type:complete